MKFIRTRWKIILASAFVLLVLIAMWLWSTSQPTSPNPANQSSNNSVTTNQQQATRSNKRPAVPSNNVPVTTNAAATTLPFAANPTNNPPSLKAYGQISDSALKQIGALEAEKAKRTPVQQKIDSQLLYADKMRRGEPIAEGVPTLRVNLDKDDQGRILVDIKADVTDALVQYIKTLGGNVIGSYPEYHAIVAGIPLPEIQKVAAQTEVTFIKPVVHAMQNSVDSEGDYTHQANTARANFGVDGTSIKVGVISDSVDHLSGSQIDGFVTVLPGQDGMPATGEGTAMLEIVNDLAPGAQLYFATGAGLAGKYQMASNIRSLRYTYGCDIIVDDELYYDESPFQDGIVAQAVNDVTANGALYFSSASNAGNEDDGTSGTWEGDFSDSGQTITTGKGGQIHSFGSQNFNTVVGNGPGGNELLVDLFWSDPLGASTNDYDVYVLDPTGTTVVDAGDDTQTGTQDPYETCTLSNGERIVIVKFSGAGRFLHLDTGRGKLSISTQGSTRGHNCATNTFGVAAVNAAAPPAGSPNPIGPYPNPFTGGVANPVEIFSSDGPRRVFFQADGTPITPGNFSSSGGAVRQKPDITAADGVTTDLAYGGGLNPFYGTSAAAPHAAAIAALLKSYNPNLTPSQIRIILTNTALDIMSAGVDRDSGAGIVMALPALQQAPVPTPIVAPASIVGKAIGGVITSGAYPYIAASGYYLFIPANSGTSYQMVGAYYTTAGVYDISTGSGTYSYSVTGSTGLFQVNGVFQRSISSNNYVGNLIFATTNIGYYSITNVSVAPIPANQTGKYELYQVAVPASIVGKTFRVFIQDGVSPFYQNGTFDFKTSVSGTSYTTIDDDTGITNNTGTYSYSKINSATAEVIQNDSAFGTATVYLVFSSAIEGEFLATQPSSGGFQIGHFVLVDTTSPSLSIQSPTAGARLTNALVTVQGTATDNVQIAFVAYQLNTNGWAAATGTTNWTAANLMLIPGTNNFSAFAVDTSGNISITNRVSFVYIPSALLRVQTNGNGAINPNYNGDLLAINSNYTMTATAGTGFVFTNWTGGTNLPLSFITNKATVQFTMVTNLILQANFLDISKPTLSITNLTAGQRITNAAFTVRGTAGDNWQVSNVLCQVNGGGWNSATNINNWTNWAAGVTLVPGTNVVQAYAVDTTGNLSVTSRVSFQYVVTNQLGVRSIGLGTISPNDSNAWLEVGRNYSIAASPASGFIVTNWIISTNWLGGVKTNNATVQFMMASNLTLLVTFADVTKPTLTISSPTAGQRMTNALVNVTGTASDNWQVAGVWCQLNSNAWNLVTGTTNNYTNWSQTLTLVAGTNTIKAYAVDLGGNYSATNTLSVISSNTFQLQLKFTTALPLTSTGLNFSLLVSSNMNGHIQVSSNLVNWLTLTNFVGTNSTLNFRDPAATTSDRRFYRAVIP